MKDPRPKTGKWRRAIAGLAIITFAGVLATACSSTPSANRSVASLPGQHHGSPSSNTLTQSQSDQNIIDWTACLRSHGVNEPDPHHRAGHAGLSIEFPAHRPHDSGS